MQLDLLKDEPRKLFLKYLIPSVSATMVTSIYLLADSIMVGKGLGEIAIAALNLVLPLFNILFGTGALFGVGGGVLFSVAMGNHDPQRAKRYFTLAVLLNGSFMLFYLICGIFFDIYFDSIGRYCCYHARCLRLCQMYCGWVFHFSHSAAFYRRSFVTTKRLKLAMLAVITGGVTNIVLDWVFIFPLGWGMAGAALASVIGVILTCLILCTHFFHKENHLSFLTERLRLRYVKEIFQYGFSSFFMEISTGIVIFVFNLQLLHYAGELGVTCLQHFIQQRLHDHCFKQRHCPGGAAVNCYQLWRKKSCPHPTN